MYTEIEAVLVIKSPGDHSTYKGDVRDDEAVVGDYLPDLQTVVTTSRYFRNAGFKVSPYQDHIRINGSVNQFEQHFDIEPGDIMAANKHEAVQVPKRLESVLVRVIFSQKWTLPRASSSQGVNKGNVVIGGSM